MPMPPVWALGFQQCRWSYFPDAEVLNIARNFREKKFPLDKLPVFARGGGIIPMQAIAQSTMEKSSDTLFIHVYPGNEKTAFLDYEDDGLTYNYEDGEYLTRMMTFDPSGRQIVLEKPEGNYISQFSKITLILHGFEEFEQEMEVNQKPVKPEKYSLYLYTALDEKDPLYNGGRKFAQPVIRIDGADFNEKTVVSW